MLRAELGIDGNCAFALIGEDLQSGEAEFVEIVYRTVETVNRDKVLAAAAAYEKLRIRLRRSHPSEDITFFFGRSHPYGD